MVWTCPQDARAGHPLLTSNTAPGCTPAPKPDCLLLGYRGPQEGHQGQQDLAAGTGLTTEGI